jgi:hypothetical protein
MDGFVINSITKNTLKRRVFELMLEGKNSKDKAWSMNNICNSIESEYGSKSAGELSREIILELHRI